MGIVDRSLQHIWTAACVYRHQLEGNHVQAHRTLEAEYAKAKTAKIVKLIVSTGDPFGVAQGDKPNQYRGKVIGFAKRSVSNGGSSR